MSDIPDLNSLLEAPDFIKRASHFAHQTLWDLFSKYKDLGVRIDLMTSELQQSMAADWIEQFRHLADSEGILRVSDAPYGRSGDANIDNNLSWDFNQILTEQRQWEIFSANNATVSSSFNLETKGTLDINLYNWEAVEQAFGEVAARSIDLKGRLTNRIKAFVYCRHDGTVCVQIFTTYLFNDLQEPKPLAYMESQFSKMVKLIRENYKGGLQEFKIGEESEF